MTHKIECFTVSEAKNILRIPKTAIKNWTIGRPLKITPSVKCANGRGSRNLYSREDLYVFLSAKHMRDFGLELDLIFVILDSIMLRKRKQGLKRVQSLSWLIIERHSKRSAAFFTASNPWPEITKPDDFIGRFVLNFRRIQTLIDERIRERK